jgi:hypothetical protein
MMLRQNITAVVSIFYATEVSFTDLWILSKLKLSSFGAKLTATLTDLCG